MRSQQSVYLKGEVVSNHDELMCNFFAQVGPTDPCQGIALSTPVCVSGPTLWAAESDGCKSLCGIFHCVGPALTLLACPCIEQENAVTASLLPPGSKGGGISSLWQILKAWVAVLCRREIDRSLQPERICQMICEKILPLLSVLSISRSDPGPTCLNIITGRRPRVRQDP